MTARNAGRESPGGQVSLNIKFSVIRSLKNGQR